MPGFKAVIWLCVSFAKFWLIQKKIQMRVKSTKKIRPSNDFTENSLNASMKWKKNLADLFSLNFSYSMLHFNWKNKIQIENEFFEFGLRSPECKMRTYSPESRAVWTNPNPADWSCLEQWVSVQVYERERVCVCVCVSSFDKEKS